MKRCETVIHNGAMFHYAEGVTSAATIQDRADQLAAEAKAARKAEKSQRRREDARKVNCRIAVEALRDVATNSHIQTARIEAAKTLLALSGVTL